MLVNHALKLRLSIVASYLIYSSKNSTLSPRKMNDYISIPTLSGMMEMIAITMLKSKRLQGLTVGLKE